MSFESHSVATALEQLRTSASAMPPVAAMQASAALVTPGQLIRYTVRLDNRNGAANAALTLTDTLPANLTYIPESLTATAGQADASGVPALEAALSAMCL